MSERVETWALTVLLVAGGILLIAHAVDREWVRTAVFATGLLVVGGALVRRRRHPS